MSVSDVARFLQIEEQTVRALARSGELRGVKLGKHWRFLRSELLRALRPPELIEPPKPVVAGAPATISQEEAAEILGVTVRTVRRMIRSGRLEQRPGVTGSLRLSRESVQIAAGRVYGGATGFPLETEHGER